MVQTSGHVVQVAAWCRVGPPGTAIMPRSGGVEDDPGKGRLAAPRYPPGLFLPKAVTSCFCTSSSSYSGCPYTSSV